MILELNLFKRYQPINKIDFETVMRNYYLKKISNLKLNKIVKEAEGQFKDIDDFLLEIDKK